MTRKTQLLPALFLASRNLVVLTLAQPNIGITDDLTLPEGVVDIFEFITGGDDDGGGGGEEFGLDNVTGIVADIFETITGGGDDSGGPDSGNATEIDFEKLFVELSDFVGESLKNFTFPPEIQQLLEAPELQNITFSFGGNCIICDDPTVKLQGTLDNMDCEDWSIVSKLGVVEGTDQCEFLRVAAAEFCGCPVAEVYAGRECPICPEGEEPTNEVLNDTFAVGCFDLVNAPAVDGDKTCNTVAKYAAQCACSVITSFEALPRADSSISAAVTTTSWRYVYLKVLTLGSIAVLLL